MDGSTNTDKIAKKGNANAFDLPHPMEFKKNLDFSFSGIKTAVSLLTKKHTHITEKIKNDIAASFQNKIIEIIEKRITLALEMLKKKGYERSKLFSWEKCADETLKIYNKVTN